MAMRLYSREEFCAELKKYDFIQSAETVGPLEFWHEKDNKDHGFWLATDQEFFPDYILDRYLEKVGRLYKGEDPTLNKTYHIQGNSGKPSALKVVKD